MEKHLEGVKLVVLFGSAAKGVTGKNSDVDIAILGDHELDFREKDKLGEKIVQMIGASEDRIDLVDLWVAPPLLAHQVGETGKLLHGEAFDFIRFRVLAWKRYLDTARFRRMREKSLASALEK